MKYTIRPISDHTVFGGRREASRFTVGWDAALQLLDRELTALKARDVVFEVDVTDAQIRLDGMLRSGARVDFPGVRIAFESKHGPLTYATDRFLKPSWQRKGMQQHWQHNVYAIAKSLERLRLVDDYGVTKRGEQYTGFKALPAGRSMPASHMTTDQACRILSELSGVTITPGESEQSTRARLREAKAAAHPDRHDGDRTLWDHVEQAARVLGADRG